MKKLLIYTKKWDLKWRVSRKGVYYLDGKFIDEYYMGKIYK